MSKANDLFGLFHDAKSFNQDIGNWNISNVTDLRQVFTGAENFNKNINNWYTSSVTKMNALFNGAKKFTKTFIFDKPNHYFKVEFKPGLLAGQHVIIEITKEQFKNLTQ